MDGLSVPMHGFRVLTGTGNRGLAEEIAGQLGVELCKATITRFADGELLLLIDAVRRASAARITCVLPYYGYGRQDRKDQPRVAIGAKLMARMIETAGADRVLGLDLHAHQLQGFFDLPVDHLYAAPVFTAHYRKKNLENLVVVAPDVGSAKMARGFAKRLNGTLAIIDKRRPKANVAEVVNVVGEVEGMDCLIPDDMIDTAGTVSEAARALKALGAKDIYVCATHALLSGPAVERLSNEIGRAHV